MAGAQAPSGEATSMREAWLLVANYVYFAAAIGAIYNVLLLMPALYTIIIYSRILTSGSVSSLVGITVLAVFVLVIGGFLDNYRSRVLLRASARMGQAAFPGVLRAALDPAASPVARVSILRYFDALRQLATGPVVLALTETPWSIIYVIIAFLINPYIGAAVSAVIVFTIVLTVASHALTKRSTQTVNRVTTEADRRLYAAILRADRIALTGGIDEAAQRHARARAAVDDSVFNAGLLTTEFSATTKAVRAMATVGIMGLACYLAVNDRLNPALIFAVSLILARAIAPFEHLTTAIGHLASARRTNFDLGPRQRPQQTDANLRFQKNHPAVEIQDARILNPGSNNTVVHIPRLAVSMGEHLCIQGGSGSGRTALLLALVGARVSAGGSVVIGGHRVGYGQVNALARQVGYVSAEPLLEEGSIIENICGQGAAVEASPHSHLDEVLAVSGVADFTAKHAAGLATRVGPNGEGLSSSEARRIMLARALFRRNALVLIDDLDSHFGIDAGFDLQGLMSFLKEKGATVVFVANTPVNQTVADRTLRLSAGQLLDTSAE
jgi:ABC-type protease/lipase transport system fused ATPase/permease subunit